MKENSIRDRIEEKYTRYINCETDILELTIEEAIFILEKDASVHYVEDLLQEAYKVILSDYKRVLKENEELKNQEATQRKINELLVQRYSNSISVQTVKDKIEELEEELEIMKVDNMYGRYKEYGGKTKWERLFATKYGMHDALQELLEGRK